MSDAVEAHEQKDAVDWPITNVDSKKAEFTPSGKAQFVNTVKAYSDELFRRAKANAEAARGANLPLEITHEHVRVSAHSIANRFGAPTPPWWAIPGQIGELITVAISGYGAGNLGKPEGVTAFVGGLSVATVLLVLRLTKGKAG